MYSSVTGKPVDSSPVTYWKDNMVSTVRFHHALTSCVEENPAISIFLEVGPHPALKSAVSATLQGISKDEFTHHSSCERYKDDFEAQLGSAAALIVEGVALRKDAINARENMNGTTCTAERGNVLTGLPSYAFDHSESLWAESRMSRNLRFREFPHHELLGSRYLEDTPANPSWRNLLILDHIPWLADLYARYGKTAEMPGAALILSLLEAARQLLQQTAQMEPTHIMLTDVKLGKALLLDVLQRSDTVELHTTMRESNLGYTFDIVSTHPSDRSTMHHCQGSIIFSPSAKEAEAVHATETHDLFILEKAEALRWSLDPISVSHVNQASASAHCNLADVSLGYSLDPSMLDSALKLVRLPNLGGFSPRITRIESIGSISLPVSGLQCETPMTAKVNVKYQTKEKANLYISVGGTTFSATDIVLGQCLEDRPTAPPLRSLFYKQVHAPDITNLKDVQGRSLDDVLGLNTHKWPACDIGCVELRREMTQKLIDHLGRARRRWFRSLQIVEAGVEPSESDGYVRFTDCFDKNTKLHGLIAGELCTALDLGHLLLPNGIILAQAHTELNDDSLNHTGFVHLGDVRDTKTGGWQVWRKTSEHDENDDNTTQTPLLIFAHESRLANEIASALPLAEIVPLDHLSIQTFCSSKQQARFRAIVLEYGEEPVICHWPGEILLPWFRRLLSGVDSILWVTVQAQGNPFAGVAAAFLRTLQSERPSMTVQSLAVGTDEDQDTIRCRICDAEAGIRKSGTEIQQQLVENTAWIGRWLPDDNLSAAIGVALPLPLLRATKKSTEVKDGVDTRETCSKVKHASAAGLQHANPLLSFTGVYVVVGGLGGLGQHICLWLAIQGVEHLVIISRSGSTSPAATSLQDTLRTLPTTLTVLQADVRDPTNLATALSQTRKIGPIKGVLNLAMLLGDAPLATMTPQEWNTALRLKVDSGWNLHKATLTDDLDVFVMFSSIASVLGNRNQAGYNIGNTFLNALASYRRSHGLPGVAIALGAMTDIGVLHEFSGEK